MQLCDFVVSFSHTLSESDKLAQRQHLEFILFTLFSLDELDSIGLKLVCVTIPCSVWRMHHIGPQVMTDWELMQVKWLHSDTIFAKVQV